MDSEQWFSMMPSKTLEPGEAQVLCALKQTTTTTVEDGPEDTAFHIS